MAALSRLLLAALLAFAAPALGHAQQPAAPGAEAPQVLRFRFKPPADGPLTYRVVQRDRVVFAGTEKARAWSHVVELRVGGPRPPDMLEATITLRDVRLDEGPADDPYYLIAKTLEGRALPAVLHDSGLPVETAWARLKGEVAAGLARHTDAATARGLAAALDRLDPEGVTVLYRPLYLASVGHLLGFNTDGSVRSYDDYTGPGAVMVDGRWAASAAGRREGEPVVLELGWRIGMDPD
ncbi:hypothetical protein, partial [Propylenella binzhouense]